jgi:hypothetical protein
VELDVVRVIELDEDVVVEGAVDVVRRDLVVLELVFVVVCDVRLDEVDRAADVEVVDVVEVEVDVDVVVLVEPLPAGALEV